MSKKGSIYLVQPAELVGTKRYKVGRSDKQNFDRIRSYKKGSRCLFFSECFNNVDLEKQIKAEFKKKFKLIAGTEYFEGDEEEIKLLFKFLVDKLEKSILNHNYNVEPSVAPNGGKNKNNNTINKNILLCKPTKEIIDMFPNYIDDEFYGGCKKLIKLNIEKKLLDGMIIKIYHIDYGLKYVIEDFEDFDAQMWSKYYSKYYMNLFKNSILENDKIYDLNNKDFIKSIDKQKFKLNCVLKREIKNNMETIREKIITLLFSNFILNKRTYSWIIGHKNRSKRFVFPFLPSNEKCTISLYKFNTKWYQDEFLLKSLPYTIDINKNNKNEYYLTDRNYQYIGYNTGSLQDIVENYEDFERKYLYNGYSVPWTKLELENKYLDVLNQYGLSL